MADFQQDIKEYNLIVKTSLPFYGPISEVHQLCAFMVYKLINCVHDGWLCLTENENLTSKSDYLGMNIIQFFYFTLCKYV